MPSHERIRIRRQAIGITQVELAKRLRSHLPSVDETVISKIERGRRRVTADELPYFAKALLCQVSDLVDPVSATGPEKV